MSAEEIVGKNTLNDCNLIVNGTSSSDIFAKLLAGELNRHSAFNAIGPLSEPSESDRKDYPKIFSNWGGNPTLNKKERVGFYNEGFQIYVLFEIERGGNFYSIDKHGINRPSGDPRGRGLYRQILYDLHCYNMENGTKIFRQRTTQVIQHRDKSGNDCYNQSMENFIKRLASIIISDCRCESYLPPKSAEERKKSDREKIPSRPPILSTKVEFSDEDGNSLLEAEEKGNFIISISNTGEGDARDIKIIVIGSYGSERIKIGRPLKSMGGSKTNKVKSSFGFGDLNSSSSKSINIPIEATDKIEDGWAVFDFSFPEANGFDADPLTLRFQTRALRFPDLIIANLGIDDGNNNGRIEPAEVVDVTVRIENQGEGRAKGAKVQVVLGEDVFPAEENPTSFDLGDLEPGEWRDITFSIYTNKRIKPGTLPITLSLSESRHTWDKEENLELSLNKPTKRSMEIVIRPKEDETEKKNPKELPLESDVDREIPPTKMSNPHAIAVVIGNTDYEHDNIPRVDFAKRDANTVRDYLVNMFGYKEENIIVIENASLSDFNYYFGTEKDYERRLYRMVKPGVSDVFVYYSGHGAPYNTEGYLLPVDCRRTSINATGYSRDLLYENLEKIPARRITVVIDACFNGFSDGGMVIPDISLVPEVKNPLLLKKNSILFLSSSGSENSYWYRNQKHGLFTYFFLKGLRGEADTDGNNEITVMELEKYLSDPLEGVPFWAGYLKDGEQTPQVFSLKKDQVLVRF